MDNRFEESFNELGLIYETYFIAKKAGGQKDTVESEIGYRKGVFTNPGGAINQYKKGEISNIVAAIDEEQNPIIEKIDEMIKEAEDDGMDYAMLQLLELKRFIEES
jgi:hypothetical protein